MSKKIIVAAISVALSTSAIQAKAQDARQSIRTATPAKGELRILRLSDVPKVLPSSGRASINHGTSSHDQGSARPGVSGADPSIVWLSSSELSDEAIRAKAADLLRSGVGILVTTPKDSPRFDLETFGIEAHGTTVLYQRLADGTLDVSSSDADADVSVEHWESLISHVRTAMAKASPKSTPNDLIQGPVMHFQERKISEINNGATQFIDVYVERDAVANRDMKNITVIVDSIAHPFRNGVSDFGWPVDSNECPFRSAGEGMVLYAPGSYRAKTLLTWPYGENPQARMTNHFPAGAQPTEQTLTYSTTKSHSFDWGINSDIAGSLDAQGSSPATYLGKMSPKASFSLAGGWTKSRKESIEMKTKDYFTRVVESNADFPNLREAGMLFQANFELTNPVRTENYFNASNDKKVKADLMTDMMRTAHIQTISDWSVQGSYKGKITISSTTDIANFVWSRSTLVKGSSKIDYRYDEPLPSQKGKIPANPYFPNEFHPVVSVTIDLGAPYLTRSPTVTIQSLAQDNLCLAAGGLKGIRLAPCSLAPGAKEFQWYLDGLDRYVNRSQPFLCLSTNDYTHTLSTNACDTTMDQKWEWRYDRLHSKLGDGQSRVQWSPSGAFVNFDPQINDALPNNPIHPMLKPWNSYPISPWGSDTVPDFGGDEPVPTQYMKYRDVGTAERWKTTPLLFNLQ